MTLYAPRIVRIYGVLQDGSSQLGLEGDENAEQSVSFDKCSFMLWKEQKSFDSQDPHYRTGLTITKILYRNENELVCKPDVCSDYSLVFVP